MTVFFWITDLLTPATIIVLGLIYKFWPPKEINWISRNAEYRAVGTMKKAAAGGAELLIFRTVIGKTGPRSAEALLSTECSQT